MVKKKGKMSTQPEYLTNENPMKATNIQLTKAVAEFKSLYTQTMNERNYFQKEWFTSTLRIKKLESYISHIDCAAQNIIRSAVTLSNHATDILHCVNSVKRIVNFDDSSHLNSPNMSKESSTTENKMQVVKPMISGHVILRPTINLRRVNEVSLERMQNSPQRLSGGEHPGETDFPNNDSVQRLSNNINLNRHRTHREYEEEIEDNDDENVELEESTNSSDSHQVNNRLDIIEEEEDLTLGHDNSSIPRRSSMSSNRSAGASLTMPSTSSQVPLLSGVFKDVRVYLSPVDPHTNVTKVRGSNKSHFKRSSEIQSPRLSVNMSNSSLTENLNVHEVEDSESSLARDSSIAFSRNSSCTSTPRQSTNLFNESANFNTDNKNINTNKKQKMWLKDRNTEFLYRSNGVNKLLRNTRSTNGNALLNDDYDPLEGPSNLLDNNYEENKLDMFGGLGLTPATPTSTIEALSSSAGPAFTILQRRSLKREPNDSTPRRSRLYVTKRNLEKKKHSISPQVLLPRLSPVNVKIEPKRNTKRNKKIKSEIKSPTLNTPSKLQSKRSPKRRRENVSLKEPSLRKKLRRSK